MRQESTQVYSYC